MVGFSGIVGTIWDVEVRMMSGRSSVGLRCGGTFRKLLIHVNEVTIFATGSNAKQYFIGRMIVGGYRNVQSYSLLVNKKPSTIPISEYVDGLL